MINLTFEYRLFQRVSVLFCLGYICHVENDNGWILYPRGIDKMCDNQFPCLDKALPNASRSSIDNVLSTAGAEINR